MSDYDYKRAKKLWLDDEPFYGLVMAAMLRADTDNIERLRRAFPDVHVELQARYDAPGAVLPGEPGYEDVQKMRKEALGS